MNVITLTFVNGQFSSELSDDVMLPAEMEFDTSNGFMLSIPNNGRLSLHVKWVGDQAYALTKKIIMGAHSTLSLIEEYIGDADINAKTELHLQPSARANYYKLQNKKLHNDAINVFQKDSSYLQLFFVDCDAEKTARTVHVKLLEPYAECHVQGLYYLTQDLQHVTNTILIEHIAAHGMSSMLFKGILDKQSSATFIGKVHVHADAIHTNAKQANHNLLLSKQAEVQTKPELEIYADDVKCAHGATVGQLDEEALFYLQSRGIEKAQAFQLLTRAFAIDLMHKIQDPAIKEYIQQRAMDYAEV